MKVAPAILFVIAYALLCTGCSKSVTGPPARSEEKPAPEAAAGREIVLNERMLREANIAVEQVRVRSVPQTVRASGRITANELRTWRVGAITDGRVVRVYVNPGDVVKQGDVLARMHSHDIHESRAAYRKAVADLTRLKSAEEYALKVRDRMRRLYALKAASLEQVEHAEVELKNAQSATRQGEVEVERARQHLVEYLQIPADREHPHVDQDEDHSDEDLIPIKAPAAGVVLARNVTPGAVISPSSDLFIVTDLTQLWMIAAVNEEHLPKLRAGQTAEVFVQAYPNHPFIGKLTKIGEELDATTRTVKARIEIPNEHGLLKPEMYATAEIHTGGSQPALFIPQSASQEVNGQTSVFVRKGGDKFEVRPIAIGRTMEGLLEVTAGLREGEFVVTRGGFVVKSQLFKSNLGE